MAAQSQQGRALAAPPRVDDPLRVDGARHDYARALQRSREQGMDRAAVLWLARALRHDPTLRRDRAARRLAAKATRLRPERAVAALIDAQRYGQSFPRQGQPWALRSRSRLRPLRLAVLTGLLCLVSLAFLLSLSLEYAQRDADPRAAWESALHVGDPVDYYAFVPLGDAAPPDGYPLMVALHPRGGVAEGLIPWLQEEAERRQVLLVLPRFRDYAVPWDFHVTPTLHAVIQAVQAQYPTDPRGVFLFGHSAGGEIATLYTQQYASRSAVQGVVTVSALQLFTPPTASIGSPLLTQPRYRLLYLQSDPLIDYNRLLAGDFLAQGTPIDFFVIEGPPGQVNTAHVQLAFALLDALYGLTVESSEGG